MYDAKCPKCESGEYKIKMSVQTEDGKKHSFLECKKCKYYWEEVRDEQTI